jgi:hypothetical protein
MRALALLTLLALAGCNDYPAPDPEGDSFEGTTAGETDTTGTDSESGTESESGTDETTGGVADPNLEAEDVAEPVELILNTGPRCR